MVRKGSREQHNSPPSAAETFFPFFWFALCANKAFSSRCFPPVASWIALFFGTASFLLSQRLCVLTAFVIPAVIVPKETSPAGILLSWHNQMHVTSYHVMNGLFMQPQILCLTLSFCTLTCQWQEVKQKNHFLCLYSNHQLFPAWMMIPFISHQVVQLSWVAPKCAHKCVALKCLISYSKVLGGDLCSPQVIWMARRNLGKCSSGFPLEIWVNASQGVWALKGELCWPLKNFMVSPCTHRSLARA